VENKEATADAAAAARDLLKVARHEARSGSLERSWRASTDAAAIARSLGDGALLAEAATVVMEPSIMWRSSGARQALCLEALGMLGVAPADGDEPTSHAEWRELVRLHLEGLSTGWAERETPSAEGADALEYERRFASLQSSYLASIGPAGLADRLALALEAIRLGRAADDDRFAAWGWHWRADALQQLGLRAEFDHALGELFATVERLQSPVWTWRVDAIQANLALLEDRLHDVPTLAEVALEAGRAAGVDDAEFFDLILRSSFAQRTGDGLEAIEEEVRVMVAGAPVFAQGWRADILLLLGRTAEAVEIFRALSAQVGTVPEQVHEWLIVHIGLAGLAVVAGDRKVAQSIRSLLQPVAHLHAAGPVTTPYGGPVALPLADLYAFLGDTTAAARYAADAAARAGVMRAPWFAASARALLGETQMALAPLSPRETEVARLVSEALTNREIATRLFLSERTVEQHVRSILHKLGFSHRAAIAAWVAAKR